MKEDNLIKAIKIMAEHHSNKLEITTSDGNHVDGTIRLYIMECVPSVINKLKEEGFTLGMQDGKMYVDDTFIQS